MPIATADPRAARPSARRPRAVGARPRRSGDPSAPSRPPRRRAASAASRALLAIGPRALLAIGIPLLGAACGPRSGDVATSGGGTTLAAAPSDPVSFGLVGELTFTERSGRTVTRADLLGRPALVGFFFTRCTGPCPLLTANMRRLQERLADTDVRLVSISVDPRHDTPEVLAEYAQSFTADPERWWFLTGDEEETYALIRQSFALSVEALPDEAAVAGQRVTHATRLVTLDAGGRVRGYYDGETEAGLEAAAARARWLARGSAPRSRLPLVNATLNGLAGVLLVAGLLAIRAGAREAHGHLMRAAFVASAVFLACYLTYHFAVVAEVGPTRYHGTGWRRGAYLALLLSHTVLALVNLPMVLRTLWLAHRRRWEDHRRLARWTFPIWLYVSATGVLVYLVLYRWNPLPVVA